MFKTHGFFIKPNFNIRSIFAGGGANSGALYTPEPLQYETTVSPWAPADTVADPVGLILSRLGDGRGVVNQALWSEDIGNAYWTAVFGATLAGSTSEPVPGLVLQSVVADASATQCGLRTPTTTLAKNGTYSAQFVVYSEDFDFAAIRFNAFSNNEALFFISLVDGSTNSTAVGDGSPVSVATEYLADRCYLMTVTGIPNTADAGTGFQVNYVAASSLTSVNFSPLAGTETLFVGRLQYNSGGYAPYQANTYTVGGPGIHMSQATAGSRVAEASVPVGAIRNRLTNNMMTGAAAPATIPTSWQVSYAGLVPSVEQVVDENGIRCIDFRFNGTPSSTGPQVMRFGQNIAISAGETWSSSAYIKLQAGNLGTSAGSWQLRLHDDGGTTSFTPNGTLTRIENTRTATQTTATASLRWAFSDTVTPVDFTLRIGMPQLEKAAAVSAVQAVTDLYTITEAGVPSIDCYRMDSDWMTYGTGAFGSATAGFRATAADNWTVWFCWATFASGDITLLAQTNDADVTDRMMVVRILNGQLNTIIRGDTDILDAAANTGVWHFLSLRCTAGVVQSRYDRTAAANRDVGIAAAEAVDITAWARNSAGSPTATFTGYGIAPEFIDRALSDTEWDQLTNYYCSLLGIS